MFTMHNPVRWVDPTGLFAVPPWLRIVGGGILLGSLTPRPPASNGNTTSGGGSSNTGGSTTTPTTWWNVLLFGCKKPNQVLTGGGGGPVDIPKTNFGPNPPPQSVLRQLNNPPLRRPAPVRPATTTHPLLEPTASGLNPRSLPSAQPPKSPRQQLNARKTTQVNNAPLAVSTKPAHIAREIRGWVGDGGQTFKNQNGDTIIMSADGTRKVRFDINNPHPHENPHMHFEHLNNKGNWVPVDPSNPQIYPFNVPHR